MTFSETKITDVILDVSNETPGIGRAAAEQLRGFNAGSGASIDTVSGATITKPYQRLRPNASRRQERIPIEIIDDTKDEESDWLGQEPVIDEAEMLLIIRRRYWLLAVERLACLRLHQRLKKGQK